jgi:peptide/nickel transport system substrate-binding protein
MKKVTFLMLSVLLVSSLLLSGVLFTACGGTTTPATTTSRTTTTQATSTTPPPGTPKYGGTLTLAEPIFPGQPLGYPPEGRGAAVLFQQPALEPLLQQSIDGKFSPRLATKWDVAPDGSSVTFTLRQGVKFHDDTPFNAQAVKWNFDLEMPTGKSSSSNWASVDVVDDYTVRVNLKKWANYALGDFSFEGGNFIVSPTAFDKNGIDWMRFNMVGTGPFKQVSYERDVQVVYEKNKDYWNPGRPYVDKIIYKTVSDPMTQVAALKSGELDGMASGADKRLSDLVAAGLVATTGTLGVAGYFPDSAHPDSPLASQRVREALEYAIDKEAIADTLSYGFWTAAYQYAPPTSTAYDPSLPKRMYDVAKAKQLLQEAGYGEGFEMNFLVSGDEPGRSVAVAVQANWLEIGVKANIQMLESAKFEEYQRTGWNNGLLYGSPTGPNDWVRTISNVLPPDASNYISVDKPQAYVDLYNAAGQSFQRDPVKEKAVIKYIYDNEVCIPLWNVVRAWVTQPYVKNGGFLTHAGGFFWNADTIWLDK